MLKTPNMGFYNRFETTGDTSIGTVFTSMTPQNNPSLSPAKFGKCYFLAPASTQYLSIDNNSSYIDGDNWTIGFWFYLNSAPILGQEFIFIAHYEGNYNGWIFRILNSMKPQLSLTKQPATEYALISPDTVSTLAWHYLTATWDKSATAVKLYVNAVLKVTDAGVTDYTHTTEGGRLGSGNPGSPSGLLDGNVDEFVMVNKTLNVVDIKRLMLGLHPING